MAINKRLENIANFARLIGRSSLDIFNTDKDIYPIFTGASALFFCGVYKQIDYPMRGMYLILASIGAIPLYYISKYSIKDSIRAKKSKK